ncbi:MAG: hypothetical protein R2741_02155 [Methanolobus sp.]
MRVISCISCIIMLLLFSGVAAADIATVHGVAYEWSTFEPLDNAIVEVNSTPEQSMVAKYGVYSFELPNGSYRITASYYEDDQLTYYAEDTIEVSDEGTYVLDLLLLPSYSSSEEQVINSSATGSDNSQSSLLLIGAVVVVIILLALLVSQLKRKPQATLPGKKHKSPAESHTMAEKAEAMPAKTEKPLPEAPVRDELTPEIVEETVSAPENNPEEAPEHDLSDEPVPSDLQEILDILKSQGGRMTQKDMRKRLKYSEGKVSLMLLDLEKRGKIQKFKKGRGNVLFLVESDD